MKAIRATGFIVGMLLTMACAGLDLMGDGCPDPKDPDLSFSAPDLTALFKKNAVSAELKVKGTRMEVYGRVKEVGKYKGSVYVDLYGGAKYFDSVRVLLREGQDARAADLVKGETARLVGTYRVWYNVPQSVWLDGCPVP